MGDMVNLQSARDLRVIQLLRVFILGCLTFNVSFSVRYTPGVKMLVSFSVAEIPWASIGGGFS